MARPERNDVDYFPFLCKEGKVMHVIEERFGNDGYATWVKLLRLLAVTSYHYLDLSNEIDLMFVSSKCKVSDSVLIEIIEILSKSGEFDKELWDEKRIVWSEKFIDSINDAYSRRGNKPLNRTTLIHKIGGLRSTKTPQKDNKGDKNPQSKVEYSKEKESMLLSRKNKFYESLTPFVETYSKQMIREFFDYWSESNASKTKMKFELQKTFEISLRLKTWARNDKNFENKPTNYTGTFNPKNLNL